LALVWGVASHARDLLEQAMQLPPGARGAMAAESIGSLDQDQPVEAAWATEIGRRIEEVDAGTAELVPADDAVAQLQATIARAQEG